MDDNSIIIIPDPKIKNTVEVLVKSYCRLASQQERLPPEFEKVFEDHADELYEK